MPSDVDAGQPESTDVPMFEHVVSDALALNSSVSISGQPARHTPPLPAVEEAPLGPGRAAWITAASPFKNGLNEDAVAHLPLGAEQGLLMVADGLGGHKDGHHASQLIRSLLMKTARQFVRRPPPLMISKVVPIPERPRHGVPSQNDLRTPILDAIELANRRLLRSRAGSATTLALVEVNGRQVRSYHIGDSEILVVSQRGRLKFSSVSHSPIGYAVESGILTEEQALFHPDRHLVSNVIGSEQMSVELGPWMTLAPRDTVLIASDGLFDNLMQYEIIELIRKGKLAESLQELASMAWQRMLHPEGDCPSKPDDLSILAYRTQA